jgi:hypothetical protein
MLPVGVCLVHARIALPGGHGPRCVSPQRCAGRSTVCRGNLWPLWNLRVCETTRTWKSPTRRVSARPAGPWSSGPEAGHCRGPRRPASWPLRGSWRTAIPAGGSHAGPWSPCTAAEPSAAHPDPGGSRPRTARPAGPDPPGRAISAGPPRCGARFPFPQAACGVSCLVRPAQAMETPRSTGGHPQEHPRPDSTAHPEAQADPRTPHKRNGTGQPASYTGTWDQR